MAVFTSHAVQGAVQPLNKLHSRVALLQGGIQGAPAQKHLIGNIILGGRCETSDLSPETEIITHLSPC